MKTDNSPVLCYEVWTEAPDGEKTLISAYWDVDVAWRVANAVAKVSPKLDVTVLVANGMEVSMPSGKRQPRTDVIDDRSTAVPDSSPKETVRTIRLEKGNSVEIITPAGCGTSALLIHCSSEAIRVVTFGGRLLYDSKID